MKRRNELQRHCVNRTGFSLIELLTVIAIIAILAAITFPIAKSARESARRAACMSNLRQIQLAIRQYQLDHREYPMYLFGTTQAAQTMQQRAADYSSGTVAPQGLYPEYIRSLDIYHCPNNDVSRTPADGSAASRATTTNFVEVGRPSFYTYSSYEISPRITDSLVMDNTTFLGRYSRQWTAKTADPPADPADRSLYGRQLMWKNPPDDTYVTMCTHHVPQGKIVVLFLNGQTKVLDVAKLKGADIKGDDFIGVVSGQDWDMYRFSPNN